MTINCLCGMPGRGVAMILSADLKTIPLRLVGFTCPLFFCCTRKHDDNITSSSIETFRWKQLRGRRIKAACSRQVAGRQIDIFDSGMRLRVCLSIKLTLARRFCTSLAFIHLHAMPWMIHPSCFCSVNALLVPQVCNLMWSKNVNEIVSTHGYSLNQVIVWKYPSMQKIATLTGHSLRWVHAPVTTVIVAVLVFITPLPLPLLYQSAVLGYVSGRTKRGHRSRRRNSTVLEYFSGSTE